MSLHWIALELNAGVTPDRVPGPFAETAVAARLGLPNDAVMSLYQHEGELSGCFAILDHDTHRDAAIFDNGSLLKGFLHGTDCTLSLSLNEMLAGALQGWPIESAECSRRAEGGKFDVVLLKEPT